MLSALHYLQQQSFTWLSLFFLIENITVCLLSLALGWLIIWRYQFTPAKTTRKEYLACGLTVVINTAITYLGFYLWELHIIQFNFDWTWVIIPEFIALFMAMDLLMFVFHFGLHQRFLFKLLHRFHHQYHNPSPIDLYVLHPIETAGFGALWLALICLYSFNIHAVIIYLAVNVLFGIVGHLGFEPMSARTRKLPMLKYLGTSGFHHTHHTDVERNYGFYTVIWDKLFGTYQGQ